ncbi:hypothetical protein BN59_02895 [Legionella massiliensis]|uniref:Fido domain-containing protein n=1 Tax=Legionella massiliensis TaxID=1034943 RepID=A0A078KVX5_9GAMM|nr:Fic family protein [Legionella massiliensis]CDZ78585.1 hypothetical protein BN59_02895 [Legionella massiliensis]CEE14323.1 hypothetical protein BN1094_02895 [Legionella massiliensis]
MRNEVLLQYVQENFDSRLKAPYVSKDYTENDKKNLCAGFLIALESAKAKLSAAGIISVFNAMKPEIRANMKSPTRRGSVAFLVDDKEFISEQGLLELFVWSEQANLGYGPRFELIDRYNSLQHFKNIKEMRDGLGCKSNQELADKLNNNLKNGTYRLRYIPPFDNLNPNCDLVNLSGEQLVENMRMQQILAKYEVFDAVGPLFEKQIKEFNKIRKPSLHQIASFIKSMILLHPFPDGNGRTFTLGILNQLLLKNKLGICLNLDPRISLLSVAEVARAIEANLIKLEQFESDLPAPQAQTTTASDSSKEGQLSDLLVFSQNYIIHLKEEILVRTDLYPSDSPEQLLTADPEGFNNDAVFKLTLQKYQIVKGLCDTLEGEGSIADKLSQFKQDFVLNRALIASRRDSAAITFLKGVLTVITFSGAYFWGIWSTKGELYNKEIDTIAELSPAILAQ